MKKLLFTLLLAVAAISPAQAADEAPPTAAPAAQPTDGQVIVSFLFVIFKVPSADEEEFAKNITITTTPDSNIYLVRIPLAVIPKAKGASEDANLRLTLTTSHDIRMVRMSSPI